MSLAQKVLIVEDEAIIALDIESQLRELGFAVTGTARSGGGSVPTDRRGSHLILY